MTEASFGGSKDLFLAYRALAFGTKTSCEGKSPDLRVQHLIFISKALFSHPNAPCFRPKLFFGESKVSLLGPNPSYSSRPALECFVLWGNRGTKRFPSFAGPKASFVDTLHPF